MEETSARLNSGYNQELPNGPKLGNNHCNNNTIINKSGEGQESSSAGAGYSLDYKHSHLG